MENTEWAIRKRSGDCVMYGIIHLNCPKDAEEGKFYERYEGITYHTLSYEVSLCFFCEKEIPNYIKFQWKLIETNY